MDNQQQPPPSEREQRGMARNIDNRNTRRSFGNKLWRTIENEVQLATTSSSEKTVQKNQQKLQTTLNSHSTKPNNNQ